MADDEWIDVTDQYVQQPKEDDWVDVTSQYVESSPPPDEPGWGEIITTNIGTGAANAIGGLGALIDQIPGFDFGIGKGLQAEAYPYQVGGAGFNRKISEGSGKKIAANVTQAMAGTIPSLLMTRSIPSLITGQALNTYGQSVNELERQGLPEDVVSKTSALRALGQMPMNAIGMAPIFNKALGPLTRGLYAGGVNALFAPPGAAVDAYARYLGGATDERPSLENIPWQEAMLEGGITGFLAGTAQAGADSIGDYRSARALKAKTNEIKQRIDAADAAAKVEAGTPPPDVTQAEGRQFEFVPTGRDASEFSQPTTGRAQGEFSQQAAQDFAAQQALTKMGVTDPVGAEIAKAEVAKAKSPAGKLEAEAKGIANIVPKVEQEIANLKKIQEQVAQQDPLNAQAYTKDIADREAMLKESQARLEEINKELNPAPINSDPVVAKERMFTEESPVYYHGTPFNLEKGFSEDMRGTVTRLHSPGASDSDGVTWLTSSPEMASQFSEGMDIDVNLINKQFELESAVRKSMEGSIGGGPLPHKLDEYVKATEELKNFKEYKKGLDAKRAGPNVLPVKLDIQNPKIIEEPIYYSPTRFSSEIQKAKAEGYDAIIFKNVLENPKASGTEKPHEQVAVFDNKNIRSAFDIQLDNSSNVFPEGISKPTQETPPSPPPATKPRDESLPKTLEEGSSSKPPTVKASPVKPKDPGLVNDFPNPFSFTGFKDFVNRIKGTGYKDLPDIYKFFTNKWKNPLASQITKADKFPWYRKSHEASIKHFEEENSIAYDHEQSIRPFSLLDPKEQMETSALAYEAMRRGPEFDASPANLKKLGFSDRVIRGYKAVRDTLDNALESLRKETLTRIDEDTKLLPEEKAKLIAEKNKEFDYMKVSNYVPTGRYGKYGLSLWNRDETLSEYIMNDSKVKLLKTLYSKLRTNPDLNPDTSRVSPVPKAVGSEYVGAHPDIVDILGDTGSHIPSSSFLNRLKRKQLIEGFDEDLGRNLASYLSSQARYISTQNLKRKFNQNNKEFAAFYEKLGKKDKNIYSELKTEIENLQKWMLTPSKDWSKVSKALATFYLANNVKTTLVNTTSFLTALPNVARYMSKMDNATLQPEFVLAKALKDTAGYYGGKLFAKKEGIVGKDLRASIEQARKEGAIGGSRVMQDLLRDSSRPSSPKLGQKISDQDLLFLMNSASEDFVRTTAYTMGWHLWDKADPYFQKNNIPKPNRHEFAKRFVRETQADYTKAGVPNFSRSGPGKLLSTFRLYHHAFFTTLKKSVMEGSFGALSRYAAVLGSLGGVYALPFVSPILKALKNSGYDPDEKIKEGADAIGKAIQKGEEATIDLGIGKYLQTPQGKQVVKYGLPTMLGMNTSGAVMPEIVREAPGGDPVGTIGRAALGVLADPIDRADKFFYFLNEKGQLGRALEQLMPRTFGYNDIFSAERISKEGLRNSSGVNLLTSSKDPAGRKPTDYELMLKRLSVMPSTWSAAYDKQIKKREIVEKQDTKNIYQRLAFEMMFGGDEGINRIMNEAMSMGIPFSRIVENTMEWQKKMEFPEYAQRERVGKEGFPEAMELNQEFDPLIEP